MTTANDQALDLIFRNARTHNVWQDKPVDDALLRQVHDLAKWGATSANMCPLRIVFLKSKAAKEKIKPALDKGNVEKTMTAPVTAIFGHDLEFYTQMEKLFPHNPGARGWFEGNQPLIETSAFRNGTLQAAYFILAAHSLGLDTGAMSGFNNAMVDELFFAGTKIKSNFLCNLGYGDHTKLFPRSPRFDFAEVCTII